MPTPGVKEPGQARERVHGAPGGPATAGGGPEPTSEAPLSPRLVSLYRAGAARANYLALDRPGLCFAAKELCRRMALPREADLAALRSLARYLVGASRQVYEFSMQGAMDLDVCVYTDWAGAQ